MNPKMVPAVASLFLGDPPPPKDGTAGLEKAPVVKVDGAILRSYAGTYRWKDDAIAITFEQGRLMAQYLGEAKVPMQAKSYSEFWVPAYGAPITFSGEAARGPFRSFSGRRKAKR